MRLICDVSNERTEYIDTYFAADVVLKKSIHTHTFFWRNKIRSEESKQMSMAHW